MLKLKATLIALVLSSLVGCAEEPETEPHLGGTNDVRKPVSGDILDLDGKGIKDLDDVGLTDDRPG